MPSCCSAPTTVRAWPTPWSCAACRSAAAART